uniref:Retrovirus-related Pol polyprotein from transposon TNT 1-94 n=1 Tax=Tanacetum cinerariifolium TaxID=118510 RepID=A0A6L2JNI0_TANCI|nr:retrovirus-related Pol polyprotein from transposon TNT 1-94 [Tanacetum cinerariifolium]
MSDEYWLELDEKALATIQLFLTREVLQEVIHETTAAGLWLKLESHYMTKSLANKLRLKDQNLDVDIDDEDKPVLLVISLPASYKHFKDIMLYDNRETLSFDDVKSTLLSKQKYDDYVETESGKGSVARGQSSDRGKWNNEKKPEKAAEVAIAKGDSDSDVYMAIDTEKSKDELIVDSGCTFHMIPHRSWTITGVRHILDLKRNLISLSTLEANGCKYSGEGGVMKIFKGALVLMKDLELEQLDVKTTFLHGHLEEEIYVEQPEDGSFLYLLLYVDDMLIAAPNKDHIKELKDQLINEFDMKDLGAAKRILGMKIQRDRKMGKLTLSQTDYILKVLKKFNMSSCKPVPTPLAPHFKLSSHKCPKSEKDKEDMSRVPYSSAEAVKCILRYLKGTCNIGLSFEKGRACPNGIVGYVDIDYAGDLDARKSLSSYIFSHRVSAISWYSSLQAITALSTTEVEYISSTEEVKEDIWLRGMVNEFSLPQEVLVVYCDNRSVVHLTKNNKFHSKTKHIEVRHYFVRDIVEKGEVIVDRIYTNDNPADMLTKVLTPTKFKHCLDLVGVIGV